MLLVIPRGSRNHWLPPGLPQASACCLSWPKICRVARDTESHAMVGPGGGRTASHWKVSWLWWIIRDRRKQILTCRVECVFLICWSKLDDERLVVWEFQYHGQVRRRERCEHRWERSAGQGCQVDRTFGRYFWKCLRCFKNQVRWDLCSMTSKQSS